MLKPEEGIKIPKETAGIVKAAFSKGSAVLKLRDVFGSLYQDEGF